MKIIRPDNAEPIPLQRSPLRIGTIMVRFVGLLILAMVVLTLVWRRRSPVFFRRFARYG